MLTEDHKKHIQSAYRAYLEGRGLRPRAGQRQMIAHIARQLGGGEEPEDRLAVVEAGTGTGKTLGYLIPALVMAASTEKKIVLATATVALQGQLIDKDLPELQAHTDLRFTYALGKGRGRFYCPVKAEQSRQELDSENSLFGRASERSGQAADALDQLSADFEQERWNGDLDQLAEQPEGRIRTAVTASSQECLGAHCPRYAECPYYRHRERLDQADLLVVNHDLVLSDLALGGGVVLPAPDDTLYLFDEAHHLPDKALRHFSSRLDVVHFRRFLDGLVRQATRCVTELRAFDELGESLGGLEGAVQEVRSQLAQIESLLSGLSWSGGRDPQWSRFGLGEVPDVLQVHLVELGLALRPVVTFLGSARKQVDAGLRNGQPVPDQTTAQHWAQQLGQDLEMIQSVQVLSEAYTQASPDQPVAHWAERLPGEAGMALVSSPFLAGRLMRQHLWRRCWGAVLTSATLSAGGDFGRFRVQTGIESETVYLRVDSPFDFAHQAEIWVPGDAVNASRNAEHTADLIRRLPSLLNGHKASLVLFASRQQMEEVCAGLPAGIRKSIQCQGERSREAIVETHRDRVARSEPSVLFGLASFSEGIDLPGRALTQVIVAKLPFSVPDDPLQAAASEWVERGGGHPFMQLTLPEAIIRLTQAVGRLIRQEDDWGRVVILDQRILTARYGMVIRRALPPFRTVDHDTVAG